MLFRSGAAALSLAAFRPRSPVFTGRETGFPLLCRGQHESRADWAAGRGRALCPGGHTREALTVPCPGPAGRSVVQTLLPASPGHVVLRLFPGECNEIKASRRSQHWSLSGIIHWLQRYHVGFMPLCVSCLSQRRVVWRWFGAFPGAVGRGRAQPQRRGTSP